ncbi:hypothetical protein [uncultured Bilophila sp.]|uniref:hypothetical protein n=1 Tax=uncultured Bilophila sp. TaxID=529385 RepID=UPI0025E1446A|nr:hypothetical protein [uncultured Bilophila sp.]
MNDDGFVFNAERARIRPLDADALASRMAERARRVARAHTAIFTPASGWSETFPGRAGYYYFADADEDSYVIVEVQPSEAGFEAYYTGSGIPFPPEAMDGKWKAVPVPPECGVEACGE